jgi:hypothetical protein
LKIRRDHLDTPSRRNRSMVSCLSNDLNETSAARSRQRQEFRRDVFDEKQRPGREEANAFAVRGARIHHDNRGNGVPSFSHGDRLIQYGTEVDILTVSWLQPVTQNRLREVPSRPIVQLWRWLHRLKTQINRERVAVCCANSSFLQFKAFLVGTGHHSANLFLGDLLKPLEHHIDYGVPRGKPIKVKLERILLWSMTQKVAKKTRHAFWCNHYPRIFQWPILIAEPPVVAQSRMRTPSGHNTNTMVSPLARG